MGYKELDLPENRYYLEQGKEINLSRGDLNFLTPEYIIEETYRAMKEGFTHYIYRFGRGPGTRSRKGLPELRDAVSTYYSKYGVTYDSEEVVVTNGSAIALYMVFNAFLKNGDEVIVTDPTYPGYFRIFDKLNVKVVRVPLLEKENWGLNIEAVKKVVTPKTKLIVLCNPLNPTGKVFTKNELKGISDIVLENDLKVFSDEIYHEFIWKDRPHFAISSLEGMKDRTIIVQSFSKTFSMTGWRLGYILAPDKLLDNILKIPVGHTAATFIQKGGAAGLRRLSCHDFWGPPTHLELWRREILRRLKFMNKELNEIPGFKSNLPESTFYLWPNFKELGISTEKMYNKLAEKKVMVDPGTKYGPSGEGYIRIGMVQPFYYLEEACRRIKNVVSNL